MPCKASITWLFIIIAGKVEVWLVYDIRKAGFKRLQELSFSYYDKTPVGWMMARMTSDSERLGEAISWSLVDLAWGFALMIGIMAVMLFMNWKLALITLAVVPLLAVISLFFQVRILGGYREVRKINSKITGAFNEGIMGAKTTKTLVLEESNLEEFQGLTRSMRSSSIKVAVFSSIFYPIVAALGGVGTALAIWFGGSGVMTTAISYGTLVAFVTYTIQFFEPIGQIARTFAELQSAQASAERMLSMIDTPLEIEDGEKIELKYGDAFHPRKENWEPIKGEVTFQNVSFSYKDGETVLQDFNFQVRAGETHCPGRRDRFREKHHCKSDMPVLRTHRGENSD